MRILSASIRNVSASLNRLWADLPAERPTLRSYIDRAKSYRTDCGCAMGGAFVVATLAALIVYALVYRGLGVDHWFRDVAAAAVFLWVGALVGKLIGIGIARARLLLLGWELRRRYPLCG